MGPLYFGRFQCDTKKEESYVVWVYIQSIKNGIIFENIINTKTKSQVITLSVNDAERNYIVLIDMV